MVHIKETHENEKLSGLLSLVVSFYSNTSYCLTPACTVYRAQGQKMYDAKQEKNIRTPLVRVLRKIRVAVAFFFQCIPISITFMSRAEDLMVIILLHLIGGWHFKGIFHS